MSFRTTGVLLVLLAILTGYVYNYVLNKPAPPGEPRSYVYQYDMLDITEIKVNYDNKATDIWWDDPNATWHFKDESLGSVDNQRVNGIRLLLSGPGANRVLVAANPTPAQLQDYGFTTPLITATIKLKSGEVHTVLLGTKTPDGGNYYVKNSADNVVYLVDYTWGDELARFVTEPPLVKT